MTSYFLCKMNAPPQPPKISVVKVLYEEFIGFYVFWMTYEIGSFSECWYREPQ